MRRNQLIAMCVAGLLLASCGTQNAKTVERPLSLDEASVLAQATFNNYDGGGATFEVNTVTEPNGAQLRLVGVIDWKSHTGAANVWTPIESSTLKNVWWKDDGVLELRPNLNDIISSMSMVESPVLLRRPNKSKRLDQVLSIITGLASEQAENAQLVLQKTGSAYIRRDELRGQQVDVMRYGEQSIYWIATDSQQCLRFEAANKIGNQPIVIDFLQHGPQTIQIPPRESWVLVDGNENLLPFTNGF